MLSWDGYRVEFARGRLIFKQYPSACALTLASRRLQNEEQSPRRSPSPGGRGYFHRLNRRSPPLVAGHPERQCDRTPEHTDASRPVIRFLCQTICPAAGHPERQRRISRGPPRVNRKRMVLACVLSGQLIAGTPSLVLWLISPRNKSRERNSRRGLGAV